MTAFLIPEGPGTALLGVAAVALVKAVYDYFDVGRISVRNAGCVGAGGLACLLLITMWSRL